jgi:hypothetical protein
MTSIVSFLPLRATATMMPIPTAASKVCASLEPVEEGSVEKQKDDEKKYDPGDGHQASAADRPGPPGFRFG